MSNIRSICADYKKKHVITTDKISPDSIKVDFSEIIGIICDKTQLICIGSRPGMGKKALYLDIILYTAIKTKKKVMCFLIGYQNDFSTILIERLLKRVCGTNKEKIPYALAFLENLDIDFVISDSMLLPDIVQHIESENNIGLVVIDNIENITPYPDDKKKTLGYINQTVEKLSELKNKINSPIILSTTLSRILERRINKRPNIRDLKFMCLRRLCDSVVLLYRDAYYNFDKSNNSALISIPKKQNGKAESFHVKFNSDSLNFVEERE